MCKEGESQRDVCQELRCLAKAYLPATVVNAWFESLDDKETEQILSYIKTTTDDWLRQMEVCEPHG